MLTSIFIGLTMESAIPSKAEIAEPKGISCTKLF